MTKPLIAGNWKMHGSANSAADLAKQLALHDNTFNGVEVVVFPPAVHLERVVGAFVGSSVGVGAQNMSQWSSGAYTGEISADMLKEAGCTYTLVGHSERRTLFGEVDGTVADKFETAQRSGLVPILCVGETLQQRQQGLTLDVIAEQINTVREKVGLKNICSGVVAYEPVWAIGTGVTASSEQAQEMHKFIRKLIETKYNQNTGGSVKASNAAELFAQPDIDGGLVGGASLEADEFLKIAQLMT